MADLLCRTLHSCWPCFHSCPSFTHGRRSALFPLLFVLGCHSRSSSHALTLPRSSISTLSSHQSLSTFSHHPLHHDQSSSSHHPCCAAPFSPPRLRCLIRAASSSLPHLRCLTQGCCLILAALPSLQILELQLPIFAPLTLLSLINRPLQVLLFPLTSGTPSFGAIPSPVYTMSSALSSC